MSAKIGFFFIISLVFLTGAREATAQSAATARIRVTATVAAPVGFYDSSNEQTDNYDADRDTAVVNFCHSEHTGVLVEISNDDGIIKQYSFPAKTQDENCSGISTVNLNSISLERDVLFNDNNAVQDSCLITLIYSEN